ncbi:hypothetical protein [Xanthomonas translucens]|uniref:hypothetical protein n=2 Tax=Xanthomonas campestris pv. translucens TaxID=343 RepID=UPI001F50F3CF|nr:hypothetical protein [Xanthomonas translucens]
MRQNNMTESQRIKFAYYDAGWAVDAGDQSLLRARAQSVVAVDVTEEMDGHLFCPECCTSVSKSPKLRQRFRNNRKACFVHWPSYKDVPCGLRSTKSVGMRFDSEETAAQALDSEELVLINKFMRNQPEQPDGGGVYQQTPVEDEAGPLSDVPISRHRGETFRLPTRISSIQMLCRRFDINLHRYYQLPGHPHPQPLYELLHPVTGIEGERDEPRLYFGKIEGSFVNSNNPQPYHLRMTRLSSGPRIIDFYLKQNNAEQESKGIGRDMIGRYVLFWAAITANGIGYCAEHLGWGEYALLPDRYTRILDELADV